MSTFASRPVVQLSPKPRKKKILLLVVVLALVGAVAELSIFHAFRATFRRPHVYLVPAGYTGWLIIERSVKGAHPTPIEGVSLVYRFPASGRLKTSTPAEEGMGTDQCYYVTPEQLIPIPDSWPKSGKESDVKIWGWGAVNGSSAEGVPPIEYAFVGTKSQYEKADKGPSPKSEAQERLDRAFEAKEKASKSK